MAVRERYPVTCTVGEAADGWSVSLYALEAPLTYAPYFYNPALTPDGRMVLAISNIAGTEQAFAIDRERGEAIQLTNAEGNSQNWAPYIRSSVAGIRPQFVCWSRPDWEHVLYWEGNALRRVLVGSLMVENLFELPDDLSPSQIHCSEGGIACFGYLPAALQHAMLTRSVEDLEDDLADGCGFVALDVPSSRVLANIPTPFWPNHVTASADGRHVLLCHEGSWRRQRMFLYDASDRSTVALRPQADGAAIGHEFWIDATRVGYHGEVAGRSMFGLVDIRTGEWRETPTAHEERHAAHFHASPDAKWIVTDGEATPDHISIAQTDAEDIRFTPVCRHGWPRHLDQRRHPHPHWHRVGTGGDALDAITFTATDVGDGERRTGVGVLTPSADRGPL